MRLAGFRSLLFGAVALLSVSVLPGCENPLDPLDKSDKIEGLTFIDFSASWERWDTDAAYDGLVLTVDYYNSLGDTLDFHDKPHTIVVEFWSQKDQNEGIEGENPYLIKDELFFQGSIEIDSSSVPIRIPVEAYVDLIPETIIDEESGEASGFMVVRVFPPQQYPQEEIVVAQPDVLFFVPEEAEGTPNP